jgi:hypothetical protein
MRMGMLIVKKWDYILDARLILSLYRAVIQ